MQNVTPGWSGRRLGAGAMAAVLGLSVLAGCGSSSTAAGSKTTTPSTATPTTTTGSTASEYQRLVRAEQTFGTGVNQVESALRALAGAADVSQAQLDRAVGPLATTLAETQTILQGPWRGRAGPDEKRLRIDLTAMGRVAAGATVGQGIASEYAQVRAAYAAIERDDRVLRADLGLPAPTPVG